MKGKDAEFLGRQMEKARNGDNGTYGKTVNHEKKRTKTKEGEDRCGKRALGGDR